MENPWRLKLKCECETKVAAIAITSLDPRTLVRASRLLSPFAEDIGGCNTITQYSTGETLENKHDASQAIFLTHIIHGEIVKDLVWAHTIILHSLKILGCIELFMWHRKILPRCKLCALVFEDLLLSLLSWKSFIIFWLKFVVWWYIPHFIPGLCLYWAGIIHMCTNIQLSRNRIVLFQADNAFWWARTCKLHCRGEISLSRANWYAGGLAGGFLSFLLPSKPKSPSSSRKCPYVARKWTWWYWLS